MPRDAPIIVWFRRDLRISDNPALAAAAEGGRPVVPVYILDEPADPDPAAPGAAGRWWLRRSLTALADSLERLGAPLTVRRGDAAAVLAELAAATGAGAVYWNRVDEPWHHARGRAVAEALARGGVGVATFTGSALFDPDSIHNSSGRPFTVFTPFWRHCQSLPPPRPPLAAPAGPLATVSLARSGDDPWPAESGDDLTAAWAAAWTPGEAAAHGLLAEFLVEAVADYQGSRDRLDHPGTSRLSPHLHWGEISARAVWHAVRGTLDRGGGDASRHAFLRQIGWREFSIHLLHHFPDLPERPLNPRFAAFPWQSDEATLAPWREGRTGYPIIDAGMRQLRQTGWMHNRLRMAVASFLVKDLLIPWRDGAAWFHEALVDADLACNTVGWQWVAGCGADAAPFFRIFNPVLQGRKFDPGGGLIRRWVPELAALPTVYLHEPWSAPPDILARAGVRLGETYPRPIIDHAHARGRALAALHGSGERRGADAGGADSRRRAI